MKKTFNCNNEVLFKSIETLLLENAKEFGNISSNNSLTNLRYSYSGISVEVIEVILNQKITYITKTQSNEIFQINFKLLQKNNKTQLLYSVQNINKKKLNLLNYLLLSNSVYFFQKKTKFNLLCNYLEENIK